MFVDSTTPTDDYRAAAVALWGEGGGLVHDHYQESLPLFDHLPASMPIVIGITAYGGCLGLTRGSDPALDGQRITIASNAFKRGAGYVRDVVVHEMLHCDLIASGRQCAHDSADWYAAVRKLSPTVLGHDIAIKRGSDRKSMRVPNPAYQVGGDAPKTIVRKVRVASMHEKVARWPQTFRPASHDFGRVVHVPTY